jgi:hypothetical protein
MGVSLSLLALAVKTKRTGLGTLRHAWAAWAAVACLAGGAWIAYEDKDRRGKRHLLSWHARVGFAAVCGAAASALVSWVLLHPERGWARNSRGVRRVHRWFGVGTFSCMLAAEILGFWKYENSWAAFSVLTGGACVVFVWAWTTKPLEIDPVVA